MSALRESLKKPHLWLVLVFCTLAAGAVDLYRPPSRQISARVYIRLARAYQNVASPLLRRRVRCRYIPTCSEYSIQAVQAQGTLTGLRLTLARIHRCRNDVPLDTSDPPPDN